MVSYVDKHSTAVFNAVNSAPNVLVWTAVWRLDCHTVGVDLMKPRTAVTLLPVTKSCAKSESQKKLISNLPTFGSGNLGLISS